jgi:hypothetical protein
VLADKPTYAELEQKLDEYKTILAYLVPEITREFFICGKAGEEDEHGLPKMILVCPELGLDGFAVYTKTAAYKQPGW